MADIAKNRCDETVCTSVKTVKAVVRPTLDVPKIPPENENLFVFGSDFPTTLVARATRKRQVVNNTKISKAEKLPCNTKTFRFREPHEHEK
jgi:hypothetical protein